MNDQEQFWSGSFGDEYTARNRVSWRERVPFWRMILNQTGARSVYEFGCNAGWNLSAIRRAFPDVHVAGCDINPTAVEQAQTADIYATLGGIKGRAELVFTVGVLIHLNPQSLRIEMENIVAASYDYVLAVEYASQSGEEEAIEYRGHTDRLWRRDYGKLYMALGLEPIEKGDAGKGFDNCTYWLMRKP